MRTLG